LPIEPFYKTLNKHGLELKRHLTNILQINVGFLCNQKCRHCHLDAGPGRQENMDKRTADEVILYAKRSGFETVDITGGAPELNPHLSYLVESLSQDISKIMIRPNLSVLNRPFINKKFSWRNRCGE
jgi:MoaA/NifB/PqqE/SkfB family radical SAM enzyme